MEIYELKREAWACLYDKTILLPHEYAKKQSMRDIIQKIKHRLIRGNVQVGR